MCLTATANKRTRTQICKILSLHNTKIERLSPEKTNVKLEIFKVSANNEFVDVLEELGLLKQIREKGLLR